MWKKKKKLVTCNICKHIIDEKDAYKVLLVCQESKFNYYDVCGKSKDFVIVEREEWYCPEHRQQYNIVIGKWDAIYQQIVGEKVFLSTEHYLGYTYCCFLGKGYDFKKSI